MRTRNLIWLITLNFGWLFPSLPYHQKKKKKEKSKKVSFNCVPGFIDVAWCVLFAYLGNAMSPSTIRVVGSHGAMHLPCKWFVKKYVLYISLEKNNYRISSYGFF